ncbi:hypothetical protein MMC28_010900 [Mycoblastus sanguinarius]|nr:hypothetical protein [Mycoblastus sanguinarius]
MDNPATHGRYSGRAFDRSLGHRKFGKTTMDCGFLSSKSQWGTLGENNPAGLLRLTLNFHEPADYKLSSAEASLCFLPSSAGPSPNVTEHLYPDILCGPPLSQHKSRNNNIEPTVEAMGASVGGVGIHNTAEWSKTLRWLLRGSRLPDAQNLYTKAEWSWQANKLNEQSELKRAFQLALVLAHSEPRLNVTVAIKGKLRQGWRRYTFGYSKDPPKVVQLELSCPQNIELASIVETLAAEIARLNTVPVPEHTLPTASVSAPADDNPTVNDNVLDTPPQQIDL